MLPIRTILCPTDFSEPSKLAFRLACALAHDYGAHLIVAHIVEPPPFVTYGEIEKVLQLPEGYRQELEENLREFQAPDPKVEVEQCLREGDPVTEILSLAQDRRCDVIVMGTHGRTGLAHFLMGSVAGQVVRKATCPVLTVKGPLAKTQLAAELAAEPRALALGPAPNGR
jgi:nucleotide-binding universal stress UspA family protein